MSESLRLAEILEGGSTQFNQEAAAELRRLHAENEALRADAARLDSGMILMSGRDSWGEDWAVLHKGVNLRAAIDAARKEST